jgi:hypothetical protein
MFPADLLEQSLLPDQKVPKFGQGPATIGQAKFNRFSLGQSDNLGPLFRGQMWRRSPPISGLQTFQTVLVEGVQVCIDGVGMNLQNRGYFHRIQAISIEQNRFSSSSYLRVGRFFEHYLKPPPFIGLRLSNF